MLFLFFKSRLKAHLGFHTMLINDDDARARRLLAHNCFCNALLSGQTMSILSMLQLVMNCESRTELEDLLCYSAFQRNSLVAY